MIKASSCCYALLQHQIYHDVDAQSSDQKPWTKEAVPVVGEKYGVPCLLQPDATIGAKEFCCRVVVPRIVSRLLIGSAIRLLVHRIDYRLRKALVRVLLLDG